MTVLNLFSGLKHLTQPHKISIDNAISCLHYRVTFIILVGCSILTTATQFVGHPIDCIVEGVSSNIMNTYCWYSSTFTLPNRISGLVGKDFPHRGLGNAGNNVGEIKYHQYYQWVCFVLSFQAILFYVPRYLWKHVENNRIALLSTHIQLPIIDENTKKAQISIIMDYFVDHLNAHNTYLYWFVFCEILNFVNVIGQVYLMNIFLGGEFLTYGIDLMNQSENDYTMERVFPKMTKCTFHQYGPSGSIKLHDGLCVLALNVLNEKIYILLWFWFSTLAVVSGISLIYRLCVLSIPKLRYYLLCARAKWTAKQDIEEILQTCNVGDWFLFYQISKNVDPTVFKEICRDFIMKFCRHDTLRIKKSSV